MPGHATGSRVPVLPRTFTTRCSSPRPFSATDGTCTAAQGYCPLRATALWGATAGEREATLRRFERYHRAARKVLRALGIARYESKLNVVVVL